MAGIFVTGTGTGVGKTVISCAIARWLKSKGVSVGVMKPVSTGDRADAEALKQAADCEAPLDWINPQFFKTPLAPSVAAALERRSVDMDRIYRAYWRLAKRYPFMVVEGVGGVKVPLGDSTYVLDLIGALRLPALVVAAAGLGTLNHTLLTVEALKRAKIPLFGIVLNGYTGRSPAELTNLEALREHTAERVYGAVKRSSAVAKDPSRGAAVLERLPGFTEALLRLGGS